MTNKVSYIIQLKDRFSRVGEKVERQFRNIEKAAKKSEDRLKQFQKRGEAIRNMAGKMAIAGGAMTAAITLPFASFVRNATQLAADAQEASAKFDQIFDQNTAKAREVAKDYADAFGVARSTATQMMADTGSILSGFGFVDEQTLKLSKNISVLGADLAAFNNLEGGAADAAMRLTKALSGETEGLKALGIVVRQDDKAFKDRVKATMVANKLTLQQARALVIYNEALKQSQDSIGATQREWDSYNSVVKRANERTKAVAEQYGTLLIPLMTELRAAQVKVLGVFADMSPESKKMALALAGVVAIGGPLLALFAGIAAAITVISAPALAITAAIFGISAAIAALIIKWDSIVAKFKAAPQALLNFFQGGDEGRGNVDRRGRAIPSAPVTPNGTVSGEILVSATGGAAVQSTSMSNQGTGLNVGMNMAGRRRGRR